MRNVASQWQSPCDEDSNILYFPIERVRINYLEGKQYQEILGALSDSELVQESHHLFKQMNDPEKITSELIYKVIKISEVSRFRLKKSCLLPENEDICFSSLLPFISEEAVEKQ